MTAEPYPLEHPKPYVPSEPRAARDVPPPSRSVLPVGAYLVLLLLLAYIVRLVFQMEALLAQLLDKASPEYVLMKREL